jgi:acetylornithine deacetylase
MARVIQPEVRILRDLVAIPSVSSQSNQPVIDCVLAHLNPREWKITQYPYVDPAGVAKVNLIAIPGHKPVGQGRALPAISKPEARVTEKVELALVCHTDTVPFDAAWSEAVSPRIRNGKLYGRGCCDVKGFLVCVLAAVAQLDLKRLAKPLALVLTADEEIGCVGAKYLARRKPLHAHYTIIGEPTGLQPVRAGKGYALAEIVVHGREAHSAFPSHGHSAIYDAARIVTRLEQVAKKLATRKNRDFDPPFTTLNVGLIRGGTAKNIVPGECRITVEWRPIPGQDSSWAVSLIRKALAGFAAQLDVQRLDPAFAPAANQRLALLLEGLTQHRSTTVAFGTEAAHLRSLTSEAVVFGPGEMTVAHKTGEFVPIAELSKCVGHLKAVIEKLCMGTTSERK